MCGETASSQHEHLPPTLQTGVGGNIFILCQTLGAVILTKDLTYVSSQLQHGESLWRRQVEVWSDGTEIKEPKVWKWPTGQLKANVVLFSSVLLDESIKKNPDEVEGISLKTCYGLLVGPIHSLILLKSRIDFQSENLSFKEWYRSFPCIQLPALADRIIIYILKKFVQNLIEHAMVGCCLKSWTSWEI